MRSETRFRLLGVLNLLGFVAVIVINTLSTTLPINGKTPGELSDEIPNLFVPAGLTFSIWSIIYILLGVFAVYQIIRAFREEPENLQFLERIGIWFILSCAANAGWILAWHYQLVALSLVFMLVLLVSLILIYQRLEIGRSKADKREQRTVHIAFSVYLGWITIATIANVTALLVVSGWNGFGLSEPVWTVAVIAVGIAITMVMLFQRKDIYYSLVVVWALLGIVLKRTSVDPQPVMSVVVTGIIGMALIGAGITVQGIGRKVY